MFLTNKGVWYFPVQDQATLHMILQGGFVFSGRREIKGRTFLPRRTLKSYIAKTSSPKLENWGPEVALSLFLCMPHRADFNNKTSSCFLALSACIPRSAASCGTQSSGSFDVAGEKNCFQGTASQPSETIILNNIQTTPFLWADNSNRSSQPLELQIPGVSVVIRVGIILETREFSYREHAHHLGVGGMVLGKLCRGKRKEQDRRK